jgi:hypothetical protein
LSIQQDGIWKIFHKMIHPLDYLDDEEEGDETKSTTKKKNKKKKKRMFPFIQIH